jgi:polar amino acid transport system substrate-binding protein
MNKHNQLFQFTIFRLQGHSMQRLVQLTLFSLLLAFSAWSQASDKQRDLDTIVASGELRVGLSLFTPWTMKGKDGNLVGSEVDVALRLATDMGVEAKLAVFEWDKLIDALNAGEIDIIIAGMAITPARALQVYFSNPHASAGIGLVANTELTENFKSIDDMRRKSVHVGVVKGTVGEKMANRLFSKATIKSFPEEQDAVDALLDGKLHAFVETNPMPKFLALKYPSKLDVPVEKPLYRTREAFAVRKGDHDFVNFLNAWIVARTADSWLESTRDYWFESLDWQELTQ